MTNNAGKSQDNVGKTKKHCQSKIKILITHVYVKMFWVLLSVDLGYVCQ